MAGNGDGVTIIPVTLEAARAAMARALFPDEVPRRIGSVTLEPHQADAARRLRALLRRHGGALLADDVGLGKTFVALAVAIAYDSVIVVHPAALRTVWRDSLTRARATAVSVSYEALSRGVQQLPPAALVILDEAHHARSPTARRREAIAALTARAHVLLLSATPVPNRVAELRALFALFLGERAALLDADAVRGMTVRRVAAAVPRAVLPPILRPRWIEVPVDDATFDRLARLPPPAPARDEGVTAALVRFGLVRRWASSQDALRDSLRRRLGHASALRDAIRAGHRLSSAEVAAWSCIDDSQQLALTELVAAPAAPSAAAGDEGGDGATSAWLDVLAAHANALSELLAHLRTAPDADGARAAALLAMRAAYPGERIVAFSEYAATVESYWRRLRTRPGVARLTARGGAIASGRLARDDVLRRFAPRGQRQDAPREIETVTLLVTTDLLAEGVDLRDATVVVHLDLPWSPTRMEQRVGRVRRLGSTAKRIAVHAMRPPPCAEAFLALEARLHAKRAVAGRFIGTVDGVLPGKPHAGGGAAPDGADDPVIGELPAPIADPGQARCTATGSGAEQLSAAMDRIAGWLGGHVDAPRGNGAPDDGRRTTLAAVAYGAGDGWLALVSCGGAPQLIASRGGAPSADAGAIAAAVAAVDAAGGGGRPAPVGGDVPAAADGLDEVGDEADEVGVADEADDPDERHAHELTSATERPHPGDPPYTTALRRALDAAGRWAGEYLADRLLGGAAPPPGSVMQRSLARLDRIGADTPPQFRAASATRLAALRAAAASPHAAGVERQVADVLAGAENDAALVDGLQAIVRPDAGDGPGAGPPSAEVLVLILLRRQRRTDVAPTVFRGRAGAGQPSPPSSSASDAELTQ